MLTLEEIEEGERLWKEAQRTDTDAETRSWNDIRANNWLQFHAPKLLASAKAAAWRPIETAPKDGTPVLLFVPDEDFDPITGVEVGVWESATRYAAEGWFIQGYPAVSPPTHYRPIGPLPEEG